MIIHIFWSLSLPISILCFFFNATAPTEIYTLSLHDALPISWAPPGRDAYGCSRSRRWLRRRGCRPRARDRPASDRKSTRLNSSHSQISYAVFCLKKKKKKQKRQIKNNKEQQYIEQTHLLISK